MAGWQYSEKNKHVTNVNNPQQQRIFSTKKGNTNSRCTSVLS